MTRALVIFALLFVPFAVRADISGPIHVIDEEKGERCFCSAADAIAAGWRSANY